MLLELQESLAFIVPLFPFFFTGLLPIARPNTHGAKRPSGTLSTSQNRKLPHAAAHRRQGLERNSDAGALRG